MRCVRVAWYRGGNEISTDKLLIVDDDNGSEKSINTQQQEFSLKSNDARHFFV